MALRLPKSNVAFQGMTDADLSTYAQAIHDGLLASIADFPTPPILPAALQALIIAYNNALAAAVDGSKQTTAAKNAAKFELKNALRVDSAYVNQLIYNQIANGEDYNYCQELILGTGYELSKNPTPVGPLPGPAVKKFSSPQKGQLSILLIAVPRASGYVVRLTNTVTEKTVDLSFSSTRILIEDLTSGVEYSAALASIGSNPTRNFSTLIFQVII